MVTACSVANDLGRAEACEIIPGFHAKSGLIDSGKGLPYGQKLTLRTVFSIDDPRGGSTIITYQLKDAAVNEKARVMLDGLLLANLDKANAWEEVRFELPRGDHTLDIDLLSDVDRDNVLAGPFESRVKLQIQKLSLVGTIHGGAHYCLKCPDGFHNPGHWSHCE